MLALKAERDARQLHLAEADGHADAQRAAQRAARGGELFVDLLHLAEPALAVIVIQRACVGGP
jgi:hypothetical protein